MEIALFGATGRTGHAVIAAALESGYRVRAHARDAAKLAAFSSEIEIVEGSFAGDDTIERTLSGCDAAISALGTVIRKPNTVLSDITATICEQMVTGGIDRFTCITSLGVGDSYPQLKGFVMRTLVKTVGKNIWGDKDRQEQIIRQSGLDYLIVRPGGLTDKPATGSMRVLQADEENSGGSQMISRSDVAAFCLAETVSPTRHCETVTLLPGPG